MEEKEERKEEWNCRRWEQEGGMNGRKEVKLGEGGNLYNENRRSLVTKYYYIRAEMVVYLFC